jgi:hypothetical protein
MIPEKLYGALDTLAGTSMSLVDIALSVGFQT